MSQLAKKQVTADEQRLAAEPFAKPWKDVTEIVCAVYGYYAQLSNKLPSKDDFSAQLAFLIKTIATPPSQRFRDAATDLYAAIKAMRDRDDEGVRNATIAAVCEIV